MPLFSCQSLGACSKTYMSGSENTETEKFRLSEDSYTDHKTKTFEKFLATVGLVTCMT